MWGFLWRKRWFAAALLLVIIGLVVWRVILRGKNAGGETATVERGVVRQELILSGEVKADEYAALKFPVSGEIAWIGVWEGQEVKKGQTLARLDTTNLVSSLQRARSDLRAAEATLARVYDEVKNHAADETFTQRETRTDAEVARDKAYEALLQAEENLRAATLSAPFAGIVSYLANPFAGLNILASETQIELVNPETIFFEVAADQTEVFDLHIGQEATVVFDSRPEEEYRGEITYLSYTPLADEVGAVYKVKVKFAAGADLAKFKIGMTGDARFALEEAGDVLSVPPDFIKNDKKGKYVSLNKGRQKVYVEVGLEGEERVEIKGDIKEGDVVFD